MTNRSSSLTTQVLNVAVIAGFGFLAVGCGGGKDQQQTAVAPAPPLLPPPPPKPSVTSVEQLMVQLNIDPRVILPEETAPDTTEERRAVLLFFDAFARGDADRVKSMLTLADQLELEALVSAGLWKQTTSQIERIDVQTGVNSVDQKCALAVLEVGRGPHMTFQPQLWYFTADGTDARFEAAPTPPGIMDRLHGEDWITVWHQVLEEELALAEEPDVELAAAPEEEEEEAARGSKSRRSTGFSEGPGSLRPPPDDPVEAPSGPDPGSPK